MVVKYVAYTWQGQKIEGVLDVEGEDEAREMLQRDNLIPYSLSQVHQRRTLVQIMPALFPPTPKELIEFSRGMSSLLKSGIPMRDSLNLLRNQSSGLGLKEVLRQVIDDIESGTRFSEACEKHVSVFSGYYVRLLRVGESTGDMATTMLRLANALDKRKTMRDKVKAALIYPVISLVVAIVVAIILVTYSLPALIGLLTEYGGELPTNTKILIGISDFAEAYRNYIFLSMAVLAVAGWLFIRTKFGIRTRDRLLLMVPVVSGVTMRSNLFSLTATFGTLLEAGIPSIEALRLSSDGLNNVMLREQLDRVTAEAESGTRLGPAFQEHWPSPPLISQGIATGEAAGNLTHALSGLAEYYEQEAAKAVSTATELIQPAVILLVAGLVGFVGTAVISGIYSAISSIE
ncbi:MAG: type II secretion system F family protein [Chloroflexi bacterium]|nr:type II secretion system F family protein [Chloroflexota bacterium]